MNDFTKKELEKISESLIFSGTVEKSLEIILLDKIQSMISGYCEHEWQECIHDCDLYLCVECGKRIHHTEFKQ